LRRTEGKNGIDEAQNLVPKCDFQKHRKWAANFALIKAFCGINKKVLLRLANRRKKTNSISHKKKKKKWHSWENILHLYKNNLLRFIWDDLNPNQSNNTRTVM
jgi:hypothetical protein